MPQVGGREDPAGLDLPGIGGQVGDAGAGERDGDVQRRRVVGRDRCQDRRHVDVVARPVLDGGRQHRAGRRAGRQRHVELEVLGDGRRIDGAVERVRVVLRLGVTDDQLLTAVQDLGHEAGATVDVEIGRRQRDRCRAGAGQRAYLVAHRGDGPGRMDLGAGPADAVDLGGVAAVVDVVTVEPDAVALAGPHPLGQEALGRAGAMLVGERACLPLDLHRVRPGGRHVVGVDDREQALLAGVELDVHVEVVRVVDDREVGVGDLALGHETGRVPELVRRVDPGPARVGDVDREKPEEELEVVTAGRDAVEERRIRAGDARGRQR